MPGAGCTLRNLTFSARRVPSDAMCMAGTAPIPAARKAASTAGRLAPQASSAQILLRVFDNMRLLVDSEMPNIALTWEFE